MSASKQNWLQKSKLLFRAFDTESVRLVFASAASDIPGR